MDASAWIGTILAGLVAIAAFNGWKETLYTLLGLGFLAGLVLLVVALVR